MTEFSLEIARRLQHELPDLLFDPEQDSRWGRAPMAQAYLDFYGINFAKHNADLCHGFGAVNTGGFRIAVQYWIPPQAKGTLALVHGYYDHTGIYRNAIAFGLAQGLAVLAFDLPGHGLSSGERVAIDSFDQYGDVFNELLLKAQALIPQPWHALGQSTGGAVLLNYLWRHEQLQSRLQGVALCAPLLLPRGWAQGRWLYMLIHRFVQRMPRGHSRNSHDDEFIRFLDEEDCLQSRYLSVRWVGAMKAWDAQFRRWQPLDKALLIIQGTGDQTVAWRYNLEQLQLKLPQAEIHFIEGAGHQLVNERNDFREQVFVALRDYFCKLL